MAEESIERGLYRAVGTNLSEKELYQRAIMKVGKPSAVCPLSALSYYELTDTIPKQVWVTVPPERRTQSHNVKLYRARNPKWKVGISTQDGYSITTIERTLVDCLTHKALLAPRVGIDALKKAINEKKTSVSKIIEMSNSLGVKHRILAYIEALS